MNYFSASGNADDGGRSYALVQALVWVAAVGAVGAWAAVLVWWFFGALFGL
jgi:hypothetical protein